MNSQMENIKFELDKYKRLLGNQETVAVEDSDIPADKKIDLNYLFSDKFGALITEFLDYPDILNLRYVNRFINKAITSRAQFYIIISQRVKRSMLLNQKDLKKSLSNRYGTNLMI